MAVVIKESDFRNLYINTRNIDKKILANMKKELKKAAEPAKKDAQTSVRSLPTTGTHHLQGAPRPRVGLRETIALAMKIGFKSGKKKAGIFIRVDAKMFAILSVNGGRTGTKLGKLPRYVDGRIKVWKHPVFGRNMENPADWPVQKTKPFWFEKSIGAHKPEFIQAVSKAVENAMKEIEKKGLL